MAACPPVLRVLTDHPTAFRELVMATPARDARVSDRDRQAFVTGFQHVLEAAARDDRSKLREFIEMSVAALRSIGATAEALNAGSAALFVYVAGVLGAHLRPEERTDALTWLATYAGEYLGEVNRALGGSGTAASRVDA